VDGLGDRGRAVECDLGADRHRDVRLLRPAGDDRAGAGPVAEAHQVPGLAAEEPRHLLADGSEDLVRSSPLRVRSGISS